MVIGLRACLRVHTHTPLLEQAVMLGEGRGSARLTG